MGRPASASSPSPPSSSQLLSSPSSSTQGQACFFSNNARQGKKGKGRESEKSPQRRDIKGSSPEGGKGESPLTDDREKHIPVGDVASSSFACEMTATATGFASSKSSAAFSFAKSTDIKQKGVWREFPPQGDREESFAGGDREESPPEWGIKKLPAGKNKEKTPPGGDPKESPAGGDVDTYFPLSCGRRVLQDVVRVAMWSFFVERFLRSILVGWEQSDHVGAIQQVPN